MPTYDYECKKCEHVFEVFHSMTENPRKKCPQCGGATRKLIGTGGGIIFKGSGFYQTDYRKPEYKEAAKKDSESTSSSDSSTGSSSSDDG